MKFRLTILLFLGHLTAFSQQTILPAEQVKNETLLVTHILHDEAALDSLVTLAVQNSNLLKAMDQEILMHTEEILQKKRSWVSSFRLGVNVFSATTTLNSADQSVTTYGLLPNVGLNLSVDPEKLLNRSSYVRQSEDKREYTRYVQANHRMVIKKDILNLFYEYLTMLESVDIRRQSLDGRVQQELFLAANFENGEATYAELLIASNQVFLAKEALMISSIEAMKKKREIQVLIGVD